MKVLKLSILLFLVTPLKDWFINSVHKYIAGAYCVQGLDRWWINNAQADA